MDATPDAEHDAALLDHHPAQLRTPEVTPRRGRRSLDLMETLLWNGGRQIRAGQEWGVDPLLLREWRAVWLALLDRYERYCGTPELLLPPRRRTRREDLQLALLPRLAAIKA